MKNEINTEQEKMLEIGEINTMMRFTSVQSIGRNNKQVQNNSE